MQTRGPAPRTWRPSGALLAFVGAGGGRGLAYYGSMAMDDADDYDNYDNYEHYDDDAGRDAGRGGGTLRTGAFVRAAVPGFAEPVIGLLSAIGTHGRAPGARVDLCVIVPFLSPAQVALQCASDAHALGRVAVTACVAYAASELIVGAFALHISAWPPSGDGRLALEALPAHEVPQHLRHGADDGTAFFRSVYEQGTLARYAGSSFEAFLESAYALSATVTAAAAATARGGAVPARPLALLRAPAPAASAVEAAASDAQGRRVAQRRGNAELVLYSGHRTAAVVGAADDDDIEDAVAADVFDPILDETLDDGVLGPVRRRGLRELSFKRVESNAPAPVPPPSPPRAATPPSSQTPPLFRSPRRVASVPAPAPKDAVAAVVAAPSGAEDAGGTGFSNGGRLRRRRRECTPPPSPPPSPPPPRRSVSAALRGAVVEGRARGRGATGRRPVTRSAAAAVARGRAAAERAALTTLRRRPARSRGRTAASLQDSDFDGESSHDEDEEADDGGSDSDSGSGSDSGSDGGSGSGSDSSSSDASDDEGAPSKRARRLTDADLAHDLVDFDAESCDSDYEGEEDGDVGSALARSIDLCAEPRRYTALEIAGAAALFEAVELEGAEMALAGSAGTALGRRHGERIEAALRTMGRERAEVRARLREIGTAALEGRCEFLDGAVGAGAAGCDRGQCGVCLEPRVCSATICYVVPPPPALRPGSSSSSSSSSGSSSRHQAVTRRTVAVGRVCGARVGALVRIGEAARAGIGAVQQGPAAVAAAAQALDAALDALAEAMSNMYSD